MPNQFSTEHPGSATASTAHYPAVASNPKVQRALAWNHLSSIPANWVTDASGDLRLLDPEGTLGPLIPTNANSQQSFLNQLAHALPYIAAAELGGIAAAYIGGTAPAASALGPSTAANIAATTAASSAVPAGIGALPAGAAVTAPAAGASVWDAAGNFTGESSVLDTSVSSRGVANWLKPALDYGIPAAATIFGAHEQASANTEAARIQAESFQKALDFEKSQYSDLTGRLAPYLAAGASASDRQSQLLGLPARPGTTATSFAPRSGPAAPLSPAAQAFISDWQTSHPVSEGVGPLYAALQAKGFAVARPTHAGGTLLSDDKLAIDGQLYDFASNWNPTGQGSAWMPGNYVGPYATPSGSPPTSAAPTNQFTTQPQARMTAPAATGGLVTLRAPNGQQQQVDPSQVAHYLQRGAVQVSA